MTDPRIEANAENIKKLESRILTLEVRYNELLKYIKNMRPSFALQPIKKEEAH